MQTSTVLLMVAPSMVALGLICPSVRRTRRVHAGATASNAISNSATGSGRRTRCQNRSSTREWSGFGEDQRPHGPPVVGLLGRAVEVAAAGV